MSKLMRIAGRLPYVASAGGLLYHRKSLRISYGLFLNPNNFLAYCT